MGLGQKSETPILGIFFSRDLFLLFQFRMGCCQACDGKSRNRAAYVRKSDAVTKFDRFWMAAVFPTDPDLQIGFRLLPIRW